MSTVLLGASRALLVEEKIVLEVGSLYTRGGIGGEPAPRHVAPSLDPNGELSPLYTPTAKADDKSALELLLRAHLSRIFFGAIAAEPKQRRVVICENLLMPLAVKEALSSVLFNSFNVSSVSFFPAPVLSLLALERDTGLVIDCGNTDTVVTPVLDGRPALSALTSVPIAGIVFRQAILANIKTFGKLVDKLTGVIRSVDDESSIPEAALEAFIYATGNIGNAPLDALRTVSLNARTALAVPVSALSAAFDTLFALDDDDRSIPRAVADAFIKASPDLRTATARAVLLTGGLGSLPGFQQRLRNGLIALTSEPGPYAPLAKLVNETFTFIASPYPRANLSWIGGSLASYISAPAGDVSAEAFDSLQGAALPDWIVPRPPLAEQQQL